MLSIFAALMNSWGDMKSLEPPDSHFLSAAAGWVELGCPEDSRLELEKLNPKLRNHPDVLEVSYAIEAEEKKWDAAVTVARTLTQIASDRAFGWIHLAFALHELKRTQEAYDIIKAVLNRFRDNWLMRYNLACYACQLGNEREARDLLEESYKLGNVDQIKAMAGEDPDLKPIWKSPSG